MTKRLPANEKWGYWVRKCDESFSLLVKENARWRCVETGAKDNLQTAHIISRDYKATRWDLDNAVCLKSGRHKWYHSHPIEWKRFINHKFGEGYYERMEDRALIVKQWSVPELKELYAKLQSYRGDRPTGKW